MSTSKSTEKYLHMTFVEHASLLKALDLPEKRGINVNIARELVALSTAGLKEHLPFLTALREGALKRTSTTKSAEEKAATTIETADSKELDVILSNLSVEAQKVVAQKIKAKLNKKQ